MFLQQINFDCMNDKILPSLEELQSWVFETSLQKSTNKLSVTSEIMRMVKIDANVYNDKLANNSAIRKYMYRVKSEDSIELKTNRHPDLRFQSVFNDILGIRIQSEYYPVNIPEYYRIVDLRNGKAIDDGYRAMHLYYKMDNFHYIIEVQVWAGKDNLFNTWTHSNTYKYVDPAITCKMRKLYDSGMIQTYADFRKELQKYELR